MKVFYLIKSLSNSGGMERVITLKANLLAELYGLNVEVITYSDDFNIYFELSEKVKVKNFPLQGSSQENIFKEIVSYINTSNPDVLISTGGKDIALASKTNKNIYKVLELHFCFRAAVLREISLKRSWFFYLLGYIKIAKSIYFSKRFNIIVALSQRDAVLWSRFSSVKAVSIVNPSTFDVDFESLTTIKSKITKFIAVGRLSAEKDFESLLLSCSILKKELNCKEWLLNIYGEGELYDALSHKIIKLGLHENVIINKPVVNIDQVYLEADFLLMTSMYEGLPMVIIEAMSFAVPCVAFDCESGPGEIITHGCDGYLVKDRDTMQFALALKDCIQMSEKEYEVISINAYNKSKNYSQVKVMQAWHDLFKLSKKFR